MDCPLFMQRCVAEEKMKVRTMKGKKGLHITYHVHGCTEEIWENQEVEYNYY